MRGNCSVSRTKQNPPCRVAVDRAAKEKSLDWVQVQETVWRMVRRKVHQTQCHETWMRWNDFQERQRLQHNSIILSLEPRAHEKIRVARVKCARCGVLFTKRRRPSGREGSINDQTQRLNTKRGDSPKPEQRPTRLATIAASGTLD